MFSPQFKRTLGALGFRKVPKRKSRAMVTIRQPVPEDAPALGAVHVRAWQRAYRGGLMPDDYLDGLSEDERAELWAEPLKRPPRPGFARFAAEDEMGTLVGFITVGPADGDPDSEEGEVYALNVDPVCWGQGCGRALLDAGVSALAEAGFSEATLWVHPGNRRARDFYERTGWLADGAEREQEVLGVQVPEVRYRLSFAR